MNNFGEHQSSLIRSARQKKGLSQRDLDIVMGTKMRAKGQITSNCERGKSGLPPKHIKVVCEALEIPVDSLIGAMVMDYETNLKRVVENGSLQTM